MAAPTKAQMRRSLRAARAQLSPQEISRRADQLGQVLLEEIRYDAAVLGYLPMAGEPDLRPFLSAHLERGGEVFVPVIADPQLRLLNWARWTPQTQLRRSRYAPVDEPLGERINLPQLLGADCASSRIVLLAPALAVDTAGFRLGQGGGFYDTMFGAGPAAPHGSPPLSAGKAWPAFSAGPAAPHGSPPLSAGKAWPAFSAGPAAPHGSPLIQHGVDLLAVVHSAEILPAGSFPVEEHDLRVPRAATESGVLVLNGNQLGR